MLALHDTGDAAMESFDDVGTPSTKTNLVQTLLTVPLLAASAAAVFLMLPTERKQAIDSVASAATVGFDGHDHQTRQQRLVLARMERTRAQQGLSISVE